MNRKYYRSLDFFHFKSESGFTVIELLIAIQLSFIVISLGYVSYLFSIKLVNKWQEKVLTENSMAQISLTLSKSLDLIEEIIAASDKNLIVVNQNQDTVSIYLEDGIIYSSTNLVVPILEFEYGKLKYYHSTNNSINNKPELIETFDPEKIEVIEFDFILRSRNKKYRCNIISQPIKKKTNILFN